MKGQPPNLKEMTVKLQNRTKFPPYPEDVEPNAIRDIYTDLSEYDSMVGPLLLGILNGKKVWRFDRGRRLRRRIQSLAIQFPQYSDLLSKHERIYDELQELIDIASNASHNE